MPIRTSRQIPLKEQELAQSATPIDNFGTVVTKTIAEYPDDYDAFVVWHNPKVCLTDSDMSYNSSSIMQKDEIRVRALMLKYFGEAGDQYFTRTPEEIEQLLRSYSRNPMLTLVSVMQLPDLSGKPMWTFNIKN